MLSAVLRWSASLVFLLASTLSAASASDDLLSGSWEGEYRCGQGKTSLTVTLEPGGSGWTGQFAFGPHAENRNIPSGSFKLSARMDGDDVVFKPGSWIDRPSGYGTVGLEGRLSSSLKTITGKVTSSACGPFSLTRTSPLLVADERAPAVRAQVPSPPKASIPAPAPAPAPAPQLAASPASVPAPASAPVSLSADDLAFYRSSGDPIHLPGMTGRGDAVSTFSEAGVRMFMASATCNADFFIEADSAELVRNLDTKMPWTSALQTWLYTCYPRTVSKIIPIHYLGQNIGTAHVQADPGTYGPGNWRSTTTLTAQPAPAADRAHRIVQQVLDLYWNKRSNWLDIDVETRRALAQRHGDLALLFYYEGEGNGEIAFSWYARPLTPMLERASELGSGEATTGLAKVLAGRMGFRLDTGSFDPGVVYTSANVGTELPLAFCHLARGVAARHLDAMAPINALRANGAELDEAFAYVAANGGVNANCREFRGGAPEITVALRDQPCAIGRPNLAPFMDELNSSANALLLERTCSSNSVWDNVFETQGGVNPLAALLNNIRPNGGRCTISNFGFGIDIVRDIEGVKCGPARDGVVQCAAVIQTYCGPEGGDLSKGGLTPSADAMSCFSLTGGENYLRLPVMLTAQYDAGSCQWQTTSMNIADKLTLER